MLDAPVALFLLLNFCDMRGSPNATPEPNADSL
jgi:hypothetical protein